MIRKKARMWFQCRFWPWNRMFAITAKTPRLMHSCITFSCTSVNGPPFPWKPMRLAGTWQQYSKKAMPHEKTITPSSGHCVDTPVC